MKRGEPIRTCVACRQEAGKRGLIRLVRLPDGSAGHDAGGRAPGRGAYLHHAQDCLALARQRRALERALKARVDQVLWQTLAVVSQADESGGVK
ncbi:MAG: YlxR family protein [Candidatus Dormibacteraeota bacterium]|uniref:YlxR family protein n=1 Tax=Candidatus Dormiibacter inghamiae TaxID=3127013 RepID=A0A934NDV8_9BACT|nr:YlxR family protein [Candidatus Dormibacteraeota bacterium]MBJ7607445.1 YlxR family protein [Candidatus Dormibacteraeota bacterium]